MMYQCAHCGEYAVGWDSDFDAEDYGYSEPGIVSEYHCQKCGAEITYFVPNKGEDSES